MANRNRFLLLFLLLVTAIPVRAQAPSNLTDEQILNMYNGLRVADVSDGMDMVGLRDVGLMDTKIEALWRDVENFKHIITGIAVTARYMPTNRVATNPTTYKEFDQWVSNWYNQYSGEPFMDLIKPGTVVVLDAAGDGDTGSIGSYNSLLWYGKGARGIVTNGSVRDTDEIIKQQIPLYVDIEDRGRGIRPGRNEFESMNKPVTVGGVMVRPGDVIVADGDGVIVVPREYAEPVAQAARAILDKDKSDRRKAYEEQNRELDRTVQP